MISLKISGLIICLLTGISSCMSQDKPDKGFAVLELFTSEGCSSCPPADELFAKIQKETQGKAVYLLAYHVDYWDRLGWKDTYSSAEYSNRQQQYQEWLNTSTIYTPQVVVNGKAEYLGSGGSTIENAIERRLADEPGVNLVLQAHQEGKSLKVQYQATGSAKGQHLLIAILQKSGQSKVQRGENAGHILSHVQIVRKVQNEALNAGGTGTSIVMLPNEFDAQTWEIVGLIQDQRTGEILGAARADLK